MTTRLAALALIVFSVLSATCAGAQTPSLRPTVLVSGEFVRIGDLVSDVASEKADIAVFRAPDLGETGSVRVAAVMEALRPYVIGVDSSGVAEVSVTRASRMVGANEVKRRIAELTAEQLRLSDPDMVAVILDMPAPTLHIDPAAYGPLMPVRANFNARNGRFDLFFQSGDSHVRLTGTAHEAHDVVVLTRAVGRGDILRDSDLVVEKRPKIELQADTIRDLAAAVGMATQQALRAGQTIRNADVTRPQLVKRGEPVMIRYEVPGIVLTARGKAEESGSAGDTVNIINVQSKRVIQGVVTGPGQVAVTSLTPQTVSAALTKAE